MMGFITGVSIVALSIGVIALYSPQITKWGERKLAELKL